MQLLIQLPRLPFSVAFDILFRHGGFAAFADAHGNKDTIYQFWRMFFVSSPVGKLRPKTIGHWVEVMSICHIVQSLPHPAHAVYLLRPMCHEIQESVTAWAIAGGRGNQTLPPEILITAMKVFLPSGHQPLLQREWFWVSDVYPKRSLHDWFQFAEEVMQNHFFTRDWWERQREGPFYLLDSSGAKAQRDTMAGVIMRLALREKLFLKKSIAREETAKMTKTVLKKRAMRELEEARLNQKSNGTQGFKQTKGKPQQLASSHMPGKATHTKQSSPKESLLSAANKQEIDRLTDIRYTEHMSTLTQVRSTLSSMPVSTLDDHFGRVLRSIVQIYSKFRRIKWNVKLAVHQVASDTGRSTWDIEREIHCAVLKLHSEPVGMYRVDEDPVIKLEKIYTGN